MGFLDDLWHDIQDFFTGVWNGIISILYQINTWLVDIKVGIANLLLHMFDNLGIFLATALVLTSVVIVAIGAIGLLSTLGVMGAIEAVVNLIGSIGNAVGAEVAIAILIEISETLSFFSDSWLDQLEKMYKALADVATSLSADVGIFIFFAEVAKAELHAFNWSGIGGQMGAELQWAQGMQTWLSKLQGNLNRYAQDPEQIFYDIQKAMIEDAIKQANIAQDKTLAEIAAATLWITGQGVSALQEIDVLKNMLSAIDPEIDARINALMQPLNAAWQNFNNTVWTHFVAETTRLLTDVQDGLAQQGISVQSIADKIKSPADFFSLILDLSGIQKDEQIAVIWNVLNQSKIDALNKTQGKIMDQTAYQNPFKLSNIPMPIYPGTVPLPMVGPITSNVPNTVLPNASLFVDDGGIDVNPILSED